MISDKEFTERSNSRIFKMMSVFLNLAPDYIDKDMIDEITGGEEFGTEYAFASLLASACGVDPYVSDFEKRFFREYFLPMVKCLPVEKYLNDPYYKNVRFPVGKSGKWNFETRVCRAYEAFVYDDPLILDDGRVIPQIAFFLEDYPYPAVLENGREWMTLMPNEINTTLPAVDASVGKVLTYGLGLGYFAYMVSRKPDVESVTIVERSSDAINLFRESILPQFEFPEKINIVQSDAFDYAENCLAEGKFNTVFTDLWHDPSDGVELYLRMKQYEDRLPDAEFIYWVEKTLKLYI